MKILLALLLVSHSNAFAVDTGNGSDGACTDATFLLAKRNYQCTSLTISGPLNLFKAAGGAKVVIKVQDNIDILSTGSIDLSGGNGVEGDSGILIGGAAGAGGGAGGNAVVGGHGLSGSGDGGGNAGLFVTPFGTTSYGGGGGGGSYKTKGATDGIDGDNAGGSTPPGSGGINGIENGDEAIFESVFSGGSGGAAGGGGMDNGTPSSGSTGGGGGGALHLVAGGNITIDGDIIADGGNGGGLATTDFSGGGGAGSGGGIWIQAAGDLVISSNGKITTLSGLKGDSLNGIFGGEGGDGRIRLDDGNGAIDIDPAATITPTPRTSTFTPTPLSTGTSSVSRQYASGVSCASVALDEKDRPYNNVVNLILGVAIAAFAHFTLSRRSKV